MHMLDSPYLSRIQAALLCATSYPNSAILEYNKKAFPMSPFKYDSNAHLDKEFHGPLSATSLYNDVA
ncbi:hypothetical protein Hanom_Chr14g01319771 [Helianthus anomalus]